MKTNREKTACIYLVGLVHVSIGIGSDSYKQCHISVRVVFTICN